MQGTIDTAAAKAQAEVEGLSAKLNKSQIKLKLMPFTLNKFVPRNFRKIQCRRGKIPG